MFLGLRNFHVSFTLGSSGSASIVHGGATRSKKIHSTPAIDKMTTLFGGAPEIRSPVTPKSAQTISPSERSSADRVSRIELWFAVGLFVSLLVLRILYAFHYRIDLDEPQHLHVVWGWTQHMIPYRDYFDNHAPLFQLLCSPLFAVLGARPDIIVPMRLAMIPLFALSLYFIARIAGALISARRPLGCGFCGGHAALLFRYYRVPSG